VTLPQLDGKVWALFEKRLNPALYDSVLSAASLEHTHPRYLHHILSAEEAAQELYAGKSDVSFLTRAGAWRIARNGLTMRPLSHSKLNISSKLIARSSDSSRVVSEFARSLKRKLESPRKLQLDLSLRAISVS